MPIARSDMRVFTTGVAPGALALATSPKWKGKLSPLISGVLAGAAVGAANVELAKATDGEIGVGREGGPPGMVRPEDEVGRAVPSSACSRLGHPRAPRPCDSNTGKDSASGPMTSRTAGKDST
jgi:hypothetical protein